MRIGATIDRLLSSISVRAARGGHDRTVVGPLLAAERRWREDLGIGEDVVAEPVIERAAAGHDRRPEETLLVAHLHRRLSGVPVGIVAVRPVSRRTGELRHLYVHPEARGMGAGLALLEAARAIAREQGYSRLVVRAFPGLTDRAIGLYGRVGFEPSAHGPVGASGGIAMSLDLDSAA